MFGKHKFKVGQRVRPSQYGIDRFIFRRSKALQSGTITKVDKFNSPTILWDGRKTTSSYFAGFIEPDRRKHL